MNTDLLAALPIIIFNLPLILLVFFAIVYASGNRAKIGRPANLVMIGGGLVLLALLIGTTVNILLVLQLFEIATMSIVAGISGFVTMVTSTIGWGMILYAVFVDRNTN